ncbi:MAG: hypothetical protein ABFD96_03230, partial [Armatimonadia bacterium]
MRFRLLLLLLVTLTSLSATLVLAQDTYSHMYGYDAQHSGVSPYQLKFPPVLSWKFTTDEKNADSPTGSIAVGRDLVY